MKKIFVFICCLGISLQGFHTYSSQKKEEGEQHYQSCTSSQTQKEITEIQNHFTDKLEALEANIYAELRGQQKQLNDLRGLMHIVISFLIGLSGFLIYEKREDNAHK